MPKKKEQTAESKSTKPKKKTAARESAQAVSGAESVKKQGAKSEAKKSSSSKSKTKTSDKKAKDKKGSSKRNKAHEPQHISQDALPHLEATGSESLHDSGSHAESEHDAGHHLHHVAVVTSEMIAVRAYFLAENRLANGHPGNHDADWHEAERQLRAEAASISASLAHRS